MTAPQHNERRNYRVERRPHTDNFVGPDGKAITVTTHDTLSLEERYCEHCKAWISCAGVSGALAFMGHHDSGDCARTRSQDGERR